MTLKSEGGEWAEGRVKDIARRTLNGQYDHLLACREIARLSGDLPEVADEIMDTFTSVASEADDLPIGSERKYWAEEVLRLKDIEAEDYRQRIKSVVDESLTKLLQSFNAKSVNKP